VGLLYRGLLVQPATTGTGCHESWILHSEASEPNLDGIMRDPARRIHLEAAPSSRYAVLNGFRAPFDG